jgi:hypothetical protein
MCRTMRNTRMWPNHLPHAIEVCIALDFVERIDMRD